MLVLSRKAGETIRVGEDIEITVVACDGKRVKLGITAPRDVLIVRSELVAASQLSGQEREGRGIK